MRQTESTADKPADGSRRSPVMGLRMRLSCVGLFTASTLVVVSCNRAQPDRPASGTHRDAEEHREKQWVKFKPPVGQASIMFPRRPDEMPAPPVPTPTRLFSFARENGGAFQFGVSSLSEEVSPNAARRFLDDVRAASIRRPDFKQVFLRYLTVSGYEAMEHTGAINEKSIHLRSLVVVRGKHYYVATSVGPPPLVTDPESDRFIQSFRWDDLPE